MEKKENVYIKQLSMTRLKKERIKAGLTQQSVADAVQSNYGGLTRENLSQLECGHRNLGQETADQLSDVYGVNPEYLLGISDIRTDGTVKESRRHFVENTILNFIRSYLVMSAIEYVIEFDFQKTPPEEIDASKILAETVKNLAYALYEKNMIDNSGKIPHPDETCWGIAIKKDYLVCITRWKEEKQDSLYAMVPGDIFLEKLYAAFRSSILFSRDLHSWLEKEGQRQCSEGSKIEDSIAYKYF